MPKRGAAHAAQTRETILETARALFSEKGFAGTTTQEIAAAAGVTVGAVFHHFASKQDVFRHVLIELNAEMDAAARRSSRAEGDALENFLAGVRAYLSFATRADFHRIVMVEGPVVLGETEWRVADSSLGLSTVGRGVEALMKDGFINKAPLRPMAVLILGALNEAGFAIARGEKDITPDTIVAAMRVLLRPRR